MIRKLKNLSFEKKIFFSLIPLNGVAALSVFLYAMNFVKFRRSDYLVVTTLTAFFAILGQLIVAPLAHKLSVARLAGNLAYHAAKTTDEDERTDLIQELVRYPIRKAFETLCVFLSCTISVSVSFYFLTDFSKRYALLFFAVSTLTTYISFIFSLDNTQRICSAEAEKIAAEGVNTERIDRDHFYGLSLLSLFILYIFIPLILCSMFTLLAVIFLKSSRKLISISIVNLAVLSCLTGLFFRRIKRSSRIMERALFDLMRTNASAAKPFPTDYSSEISYFTYLFNKTIILFKHVFSNIAQVNADINESSADLSTISTEMASTSTEQNSTSNEILATMKSVNSSIKEIEAKANEVLKVAETTVDQVNGNFETLRLNSEMMKDIKESNSATIQGIQSLSNKISNIQDIVNLISTVTAQTKIIAFNAELEANGINAENEDFQNVAVDIRSLADSTIRLTNEIQESIHEIHSSNENLIKTGKAFIQRINEGSAISEELEQNFYNIQKSAATTANEAQDIQQSVPEQILSFKQIEGALQDINTRLNDLNDSTHKITLSVDKLKTESSNLAMMMLDIEGGI